MSGALTADRLREVLNFDPDTGVFRWIARTSKFSHMHPGDIAGGAEIAVEVHEGTVDNARSHAYGANQSHGLRRTDADKKKAVDGMLAH